MANSNSINLATETIRKINGIKQSLRQTARSCAKQLNEINSLIDNQGKKDILIDGLEGLSVSSADLKTEKDSLQIVCNNILSNVAELTS